MAEEQENNLNLGENERVGDYLRRIREARGLDLEHLAKSIRLGKNILQAIEDNNWNFFPTEAYLRSYIISLCDKLSLDKNAVLKKFSAEINSQFGVTQTNMAGKLNKEENSSTGTMSKVAIVIIIAIIIILFFVNKTLNSDFNDSYEELAQEEPQKIEEQENLEEIIAEPQSKNDSVSAPLGAAAAVLDTLRFECSPSPTDNTCGITLKGVDTKMNYFTKMTSRYINRSDTAQIIITVPERTKMFVNNVKAEYGKFNTLLFYNGNIVHKTNRELK